MSNFSTKLEDASEGELKHWVNEGDFHIVPVASEELTRRSLERLQKTIESSDKNTLRYSRRLIDLTVLLFFVMLVQVFISVIAIPQNWLIKILLLGIILYVVYFAARRILEGRKIK